MRWRASVTMGTLLLACGPQLVPAPPEAALGSRASLAPDASAPDTAPLDATTPDARASSCDRHPLDGGDVADVLYACARRAYDGEDLAVAARLFREVAFDHPTSSVGVYAAQLYFDCLNRMSDHETDWHAEVTTVLALYCGAERAKHVDDCRRFQLVDAQVRFRAAAALFERASRNRDGAEMERAGDAFVALYRQDCGKAVEKCDELLYDAVIAYLGAGRRDRAEATAQLVFDPKNRMNDGPIAKKLRCKLGDGGTC